MKTRIPKILIFLVLLSFLFSPAFVLADQDTEGRERRRRRGQEETPEPPDDDTDEASPVSPDDEQDDSEEISKSSMILSGPIIASPVEIEESE